DEELTMTMLYRRHANFAIGHGVGVHTRVLADDPTRAVSIFTRVVPGYDVPRTDSPQVEELPGLSGLLLDMKELAEMPAGQLAKHLLPLTTAYRQWITEQRACLDDPHIGLAPYQHVASQGLEACERTLARITAGIDLLSQNVQAARAFT